MILCRKCNNELGVQELKKVFAPVRWVKNKHFPWWLDVVNKIIKKFNNCWFTQKEIEERRKKIIQKKMEKELQKYNEKFIKK
jgi:hypothetical protein